MAADALEVLLNDRKVGVISALGGDQSIFSFDDAYADDPDRPTLTYCNREAVAAVIVL